MVGGFSRFPGLSGRQITVMRAPLLKGDDGVLAELGYRITGSPDLYEHQGKRPYASINFVTAHDGFTLNDLAQLHEKHNKRTARKQDGDNKTNSWTAAAEGPTDDPKLTTCGSGRTKFFSERSSSPKECR